MFAVTCAGAILHEIGADGTTIPRGSTRTLFRVDLAAGIVTPFVPLRLAKGRLVGGCTELDLSRAGVITAACSTEVLTHTRHGAGSFHRFAEDLST